MYNFEIQQTGNTLKTKKSVTSIKSFVPVNRKNQPITKDEYLEKVEYNTNVLKTALKNKQSLNTILDKVYTYDNNPGEVHWSLLNPKWADIIPATFLGHLAITEENNGADGFRYCNNTDTFIETEYKVSTFRSSKIICGPKGGLQIPLSNPNTTPSGITSQINAVYSIHTKENLDTKNRETYLCLTDVNNKEFDFIDFYCVSGEKILESLSKSNKTQRSITFGYFKNNGHKVSTVAPVYTWELFEIEQKMLKHPDLTERKHYEADYKELRKKLKI